MFILMTEVPGTGFTMQSCKVFRSEKKAETYLYLAEGMKFDDLPTELQDRFGEPVFVLNLELSANRKLARANVENVLQSLSEIGYFLQLPPELPVEEEISRRFS